MSTKTIKWTKPFQRQRYKENQRLESTTHIIKIPHNKITKQIWVIVSFAIISGVFFFKRSNYDIVNRHFLYCFPIFLFKFFNFPPIIRIFFFKLKNSWWLPLKPLSLFINIMWVEREALLAYHWWENARNF